LFIQLCEQAVARFCVECMAHAAWYSKGGVNAALTQLANDRLTKFAQAHRFEGKLGVGLHQSNYITRNRVMVKAEDQVRPG